MCPHPFTVLSKQQGTSPKPIAALAESAAAIRALTGSASHASRSRPISAASASPLMAAAAAAAAGASDAVSPLDVLYLTLSSQSTAPGVKRMLEGLLTRRRRMVLGPPVGKTAVLWVDDVNAAGRDAFETQVREGRSQ